MDTVAREGAAKRGAGTMRRRLLLLGVALVLGATLLEGTARVLCRTDEQRRERLLHGDDYWIDRFVAGREAGRGVEPGGAPGPGDGLHVRDERLGWAPAPGFVADGVTIDALGLRGAAEIELRKPEGERRIVVVGDSFTFGEGVRDEEVWVARLAAKLPGLAVLNLGVLGYGLDQMCLRLESLGVGLAPDLVLVGLFGPDLDRDVLSFRDQPKPRFELDGDGLRLVNVPVPNDEASLSALRRPRVACYAWSMLRKALADRAERRPDAEIWELARRILDRMHAAATAAGARFAIAYFPSKPMSFSRRADRYESTVVEWAAARGVPLVNVRETFAELGSGRHREVWKNHWTPFGNEVVADAVHAGLTELGVLPLD